MVMFSSGRFLCWTILWLACLICVGNGYDVDLKEFKDTGFQIGPKFVGVTIDSGIFNYFSRLQFQNPKVQTLAKGLAPNIVRVGGTDCDFVIFNDTVDTSFRYRNSHPNTTMTVQDWDKLNNFVQGVGWDLIFDFNEFLRKGNNWNPDNAIEVLKYSQQKGYKLWGYELGNELDVFPDNTLSTEQIAADFIYFRKLLESMPGLSPFTLLGPDAGSVGNRSYVYMTAFFKAGGVQAIDISTWHHYYMNSLKATVEKFHDVKTLESLRPSLTKVLEICRQLAPGKEVWLGETSSSYGGGAHELSDRYVASFLWLDKLGLASSLGIQGILRQTFYGGNYGLIGSSFDPNPDYWLTYLYKRLVGGPVLTVPQVPTDFRLYAHCTNTNSSSQYEKGSVTMYFLNLGVDTIPLDFPDIFPNHVDVFIFSPGESRNLTSKSIRMNGQLLELKNDYELPPLIPESRNSTVHIEAYEMGYIVLPGTQSVACL